MSGTRQAQILEETAVMIPFGITASHLWILFLLAVIGFGVMSWVMLHHWQYYGIKGNSRIFAKSLFFVGGVSFLVLLALLATAYSIIQ